MSSARLLRDRPELWLPDNLLTLQEYFRGGQAQGIVRMEFLGGELLYAMRVVSHGSFNLCPSEVCNPETGESHCEVPRNRPARWSFILTRKCRPRRSMRGKD